jgi:flagellin
MGLRINTNVEAFNGHRNLSATSTKLAKSMEKLSSGFRINTAADDAAGLGISEKMRGQIRGLAQAQRNIQDGVGLVQTAESGLDEVHSMLQRVRELAVQYRNGAMSPSGQAAIQTEVNQLASEIERIGATAQFNGIPLLNAAGTVTFQVGANDGEEITVPTISLGAVVGTNAFALSPSNTTDLTEIDDAIDAISAARADFGSVQNRLEHTLAVQATSQENLVASESRIRDVDMASEMTKLTKEQILTQAGTAMLAQANQAPNAVLSLLRG